MKRIKLFLFIKGEPWLALLAAQAHGASGLLQTRGLGFVVVGTSQAFRETIIEAEMQWAAAAQWLAEPPREAPFPDGTLFYYAEVKP